MAKGKVLVFNKKANNPNSSIYAHPGQSHGANLNMNDPGVRAWYQQNYGRHGIVPAMAHSHGQLHVVPGQGTTSFDVRGAHPVIGHTQQPSTPPVTHGHGQQHGMPNPFLGADGQLNAKLLQKYVSGMKNLNLGLNSLGKMPNVTMPKGAIFNPTKEARLLGDTAFNPAIKDARAAALQQLLQGKQNQRDIHQGYGALTKFQGQVTNKDTAAAKQAAANFGSFAQALAGGGGGTASASPLDATAANDTSMMDQAATDQQSFDQGMQGAYKAEGTAASARQRGLDSQALAQARQQITDLIGQRGADIAQQQYQIGNDNFSKQLQMDQLGQSAYGNRLSALGTLDGLKMQQAQMPLQMLSALTQAQQGQIGLNNSKLQQEMLLRAMSNGGNPAWKNLPVSSQQKILSSIYSGLINPTTGQLRRGFTPQSAAASFAPAYAGSPGLIGAVGSWMQGQR